jgi:cytidylate kinase
MSFIVAIDGPAGTGKGTITKLIAKELGLVNIDTGAMYRCATLQTLRQGITNIKEKEKIIQIAQNIDIKMKSENGEQQIYLNNENVSKEIRSKEVSAFVSPVSSIPEVRKIMVDMQRKMAQNTDVIMEGRDITTVVFPNANVKIYLDASVEERAKRRYKENQEKGISMTYEEVLEAIKTRDYNDMNKPVGALKIADDAIVIDTTKLSIEQVKEQVKEIIFNKKEEN